MAEEIRHHWRGGLSFVALWVLAGRCGTDWHARLFRRRSRGTLFLSFYFFVMLLGAILQRRCEASCPCFGKVSGAPRQSCEKPSSSVSPIVQHPQEHADRFWRLAYLDGILIAGYADEGVSLLMRAERADVFNLNMAFSPAPVSYHDPVFAHLY
jgi:hypothetical protein